MSHFQFFITLKNFGFLILLALSVNKEVLGKEWPTYDFVIVNAKPHTPVIYQGVSEYDFSGEQALLIADTERYLNKVAHYYQSMGFKEPDLEIISGRDNLDSYLIRFNDYPEIDENGDPTTHAQYATDNGYIEADLSRVFEGNKISDRLIEGLAHELFHAVQKAYLDNDDLSHGNWITEGQAEAIGIDTARCIKGVDVWKFTEDDYRLGGRNYFIPLPTEIHDITYRSASFWRYLAELNPSNCTNHIPDPNYKYMVTLFENNFTGPNSENADLNWLDQGLYLATNERLPHHYAHFAATIADYVPSRLTKKLTIPSGGTVEDAESEASDKWLKRLYESCETHTLSESANEINFVAPLQKNAARCFKVDIQKKPSKSSKAATTGAEFLKRIRKKNNPTNESDALYEDLAIKARASDRESLEALWLGVSGGQDVSQAYIGRDREGYVGYWYFSVKTGKPQTFIISNMSENPNQSTDQDIKLNLYTNFAQISSTSGNMGDVGGPINLKFDKFLQKEILSAMTETQINAGIERPCMIRLNMKESSGNTQFYLAMDNDGSIMPGSFQAADTAATEDVPGRFIASVSFGSGANSVSYGAVTGSLELTAFSPFLVQGNVTILGKMPKRVYAEKESSWPETLSIKTEFSLVPRVNLNSNLFKNNYCFDKID